MQADLRRVEIFHTDRGSEFKNQIIDEIISAFGIKWSLSKAGTPIDNACAEDFFALLKSELLYLQKFESVEHFKAELIDYLNYYNNRRIKAKLKGL